MILAVATPELRQQFNIKGETAGVLISDVKADSLAAKKGLKAGDMILEVGQEEVKAPEDVTAKIKQARDAGRKTVLLLVDRQGDLRFIAMNLNGD